MQELDLNSGALAPVASEQELDQLQVVGTIPAGLSGTLIRNGPNPLNGTFEGNGVLNWWPEAAMLHAVEFDGCANAPTYRNRWVRTHNWATHNNAPNPEDFPATNPNVNLIEHAGELLALAESGAPVAINTHLASVGPAAHHPGLADAVTAHPKVDPHTGELMSFRANWEAPFLSYNVHSKTGEHLHSTPIDVPEPAMMHDMAITATHSVFFDLNVAYDFSLFAKGYRIPICWQDARTSRLGIIPRHAGDNETQWLTIEPCFIQHVINAYDQTDQNDHSIVLDVMRYPHYLRLDETGTGFLPDPLATPWRYTLNLTNGTVEERELSALNMELPRINETFNAKPYRFAYAVEQPTTQEMRGICKLDVTNGHVTKFELPRGDQNSEPVFVADPTGSDEDSGWVLTCVYREKTHTTDVGILDAKNIAAEPIAIVKLPCRIPAGFHGVWVGS